MMGMEFSIVKATRKRKSRFSSREEAKEHFRNMTVFKNFHNDSLDHYVQYGLEPEGAEFRLSFSRDIEAQIYNISTPIMIPKLKKDLEIAICFGEDSEYKNLTDLRWKTQKNSCNGTAE